MYGLTNAFSIVCFRVTEATDHIVHLNDFGGEDKANNDQRHTRLHRRT